MRAILLKLQYVLFTIAIFIAVILCAPQFFIGVASAGISGGNNGIRYLKSILPATLSIYLTVVGGGMFVIFLFIHIATMRGTKKILILDSLTGFTNFSYFESRYDLIINKNKRLKYALIIFEIKEYEKYANVNGSEKAEHLLKIIIQTIDKLNKRTDMAARRNTCEFIVLSAYEKDLDVSVFIERVTELIKEVTMVSGFNKITDSQGFDKQLEKANSALHLARSSSYLKSADYSDTIRASQKQFIEDNMQAALNSGELSMVLQPKFSLKDNKYCGAKALIRWERADGTVLHPSEFIRIFEERGFIIKTDLNMVERACQRIRRWIDAGETPIPISLSISKKYFINNVLIKGVVESIKRNNVPPELIELEIAETNVAITVRQLIEVGKEFQDREFLIDDGGSRGGSSLLGIIDSMPAHYINLSRNMSISAMGNFKNLSLLKSMISILAEKGIYTVADGIETTAHLETVKTLGCAVAYGFYYSMPIPVNKFEYLVFGKVID